jgi:hypothetical protein
MPVRRLFVGLLSLSLLAPLAVSEITDPVARIPGDALAAVVVTDLDALIADYERTASYRATQDPAAAALEDTAAMGLQVGKVLEERIAEILGTTPEALDNPFGRFAVGFVTAPAGTEDEPEVVAAVGVTKRDVMQEYLENVIRELSRQADERVTEDFAGATIYTFENRPGGPGDAGEPGDEFEADFDNDPFAESSPAAIADALLDPENLPEEFALCFTGTELVVADGAAAIKRFLRGELRGESLARNAEYRRIEQLFEDAGQLRFFVNLPAIFALATRDGRESESMQQALGLDGFGPVVGHLRLATRHLEGRFDAQLFLRGERTGIAKLISMPNEAFEPPAYYNDRSVWYSSLQFRPLAVYEEVQRMLRQIDPQTATEMEAAFTQTELPTGEPLNLKEDVLAVLEPPLTFGIRFEKPYTADSLRLLFSMGHNNRAKMARLMELLNAVPRDVAGTTIYDNVFGMGVTAALTRDEMIVGNRTGVEAAAQAGQGDTLARTEHFRQVTRHGLSEGWMVFFVDTAAFNEAVYAMAAGDAAGQPPMFDPFNMFVWGLTMGMNQLSESELESLKALNKYQTPTAFMLQTTPDGVRLTAVALAAEGDEQ